MNIEKIAKKLKPLMPNQVQHWMRTMGLAAPELKTLIEKQIVSTAYKKLGDFQNKILLSLPPEKTAKGTINLGTIIYDKEKWPFGISTNELTQNMAVLGRSGAGKTNVSFHILKQLIDRKIPFVFMDWKRTVRHLIPGLKNKIDVYTPGRNFLGFPFNPFVVPPGVESNVYVNQIIDVMSDAFTLGDGSRSVLQKAISSLYKQGNLCPAIKEIIAQIDKIPDKQRVRSWKISALRALESLEFSEITTEEKISQEKLASKLLHGNTVIEMDGLTRSSKEFLIPILALWLYYVRMQSPEREKLRLVIFIEEAHHVLYRHDHSAKETVLEMLFRQCRELGIGIIVLDQHPHLLSSAALGNTYTTIFLNQKDPSDINKASGISLIDSDDKKYFSMLPVGQGIIKIQDRWSQPFLVQFPLVNVKKGSVTDDLLARYSALSKTANSARNTLRNTSFFSDFQRVPRVPLYDKALDKVAFVFLHDILSYPDDGVKERYRKLGLSIGKGNRLKELLLDHGWLETQVVELANTRKVLVRLTRPGKEALGIKSDKALKRESIVHEYWKRFYGQRFQEQGYKVQIEAARKSGNVDVLAVKNEKSVAIEIETGKSDIIRNVKQNLLSGFDKILIVATDDKAWEKVERVIAEAGLMGIGRIEIILRDERR